MSLSRRNQQVFHPFRAIGLFCDSVPFAIQKQGNTYFIGCSIEKTFQIYNSDKLDIIQVGGQHESNIKAIAIHKRLTITSCGAEIHVWHRSTLKSIMSSHRSEIDHLLLFGNHVLSSSRNDNVVDVWDFRQAELYTKLELDDYLHVTCVMHPNTYLNKVLIGTLEGELQLWNIKTQKLVYKFKGWNTAVTCIEQSPVVDIVAIGLANGKIILHNLKADKTLFKFEQAEGSVTTLSFRTDGGFQHLVSGSTSGTLAVWDLEKQKLITLMNHVHDGPIKKAYFFQAEPILLTSGTDNSINMWIFDQSDGSARLLKARSGHSMAPTKIRFYSTSSTILSGSQDRSFRFFSTIRDQRSREISQGHIQSTVNKLNKHADVTPSSLKQPPIVDFDFNLSKQMQWDNVVSCHRGSNYAITWNKQNLVIGKYKFVSSSPKKSTISAVAMSSCGNYSIIGSQSGYIDKFNIQSGIRRGSFPDPKHLDEIEVQQSRHSSIITGLCVDATNRFLISSSLDGCLKFWTFNDGALFKNVELGCAITQICLSKESSLLAAVTDDFTIHVFDIDTQVCVRRFIGHSAQITDLTFSEDARWIVSASGDSSLRVWDLPTGHCVEWLTTPSPIVSITMSPRGDFLATAHVDSRGIYLWANQNYFANLFLQPVTSPNPVQVALPNVEAANEGEDAEESENEDEMVTNKMQVDGVSNSSESEAEEERNEQDGDEDNYTLTQEMITLSKAPKSKWKTLINLDLINERNKPEKAPEVPKSAPFFLPTLPGVKTRFIAAPETGIELPDLKKIDMSKLKPTTEFIAALLQAHSAARQPSNSSRNSPIPLQNLSPYANVAKMVVEMSPSAIDFEIRSLSTENNMAEFSLILRFILDQLQRNINYELAESMLNLVVKHQGDSIAAILEENTEIAKLLEEIQVAQAASWNRLQSLFHSNMCLVSYFSNMQ